MTRRRSWPWNLLIALLIGGAVGGLTYAWRMKTSPYQATVILDVTPSTLRAAEVDQKRPRELVNLNYEPDYRHAFTQPDILARVLSHGSLLERHGGDLATAVQRLKNNLRIEETEQAFLLKINYTSSDQFLAYDTTQAAHSVYRRWWREEEQKSEKAQSKIYQAKQDRLEKRIRRIMLKIPRVKHPNNKHLINKPAIILPGINHGIKLEAKLLEIKKERENLLAAQPNHTTERAKVAAIRRIDDIEQRIIKIKKIMTDPDYLAKQDGWERPPDDITLPKRSAGPSEDLQPLLQELETLRETEQVRQQLYSDSYLNTSRSVGETTFQKDNSSALRMGLGAGSGTGMLLLAFLCLQARKPSEKPNAN